MQLFFSRFQDYCFVQRFPILVQGDFQVSSQLYFHFQVIKLLLLKEPSLPHMVVNLVLFMEFEMVDMPYFNVNQMSNLPHAWLLISQKIFLGDFLRLRKWVFPQIIEKHLIILAHILQMLDYRIYIFRNQNLTGFIIRRLKYLFQIVFELCKLSDAILEVRMSFKPTLWK